jgi:hypothetical protein
MKTSRKVKALGLGLLALCAASAVMASAAQAGTFTAGNYPATMTGQNVGGAHEFTTVLGTMKCGVKFHGVLAAASQELTLSPDYGTSCQLEGSQVHVQNNGCDFRLHAGATVVMDQVKGALDVRCPDGNKIDFEITAMQVCHLTVPEQLGLNHVTYTDKTAAEDVDVDLHLTGLFYELDNGCPFVGAFGGTYTGTTTLAADYAGMPTSFTVD